MTDKLSNAQIAWRAAQDIADGAYVNLGIGFPEMVAQFQPPGRQAIFHTENGILNFGEAPAAGRGGLGPDQCRQEGGDAEAGRRLLPPCRQLRHGARRASGRGDPRRLSRWPKTAIWPTGPPGPRACRPSAARWTWCMAPSAVAVITDHVTKDGKPKLVQALHPAADRRRLRDAHLHQPGRHRHRGRPLRAAREAARAVA